jgi:hypothetical protein
VLRDDAVERRELFAAGDLEKLLSSISERQDELAADALALGERVYAEKHQRSRWPAGRQSQASHELALNTAAMRRYAAAVGTGVAQKGCLWNSSGPGSAQASSAASSAAVTRSTCASPITPKNGSATRREEASSATGNWPWRRPKRSR